MSVKVILPQLGESIAEGTIVKWLKQEGDVLQEDEPLAEVETDKVTVEIPSPASGILSKILVPVGVATPVESPIALITAPGETVEEVPVSSSIASLKTTSSSSTSRVAFSKHYSPVVLALAEKHEVDLDRVQGTGFEGRVRKQDVLAYLEQRKESPQSSALSLQPSEEEEVLTISTQRRLIAERMVQSKHISPHVTTMAIVDMTGIVRWREKNKDSLFTKEGVKLTYLPFVLRATVKALQAFRTMNSRWEDRGIVMLKQINLGIAVATDKGLIVPVIKGAQDLSLLDLARTTQDLAERARTRKLSMSDVEGGTFTVTNPGGYGALFDTPIIHQPQAAILSMGTIRPEPVIINDAIAIRSMMYLSLSYDHRINDGDTAVQFLQNLRRALEEIQ